jgi:hypothetical protein
MPRGPKKVPPPPPKAPEQPDGRDGLRDRSADGKALTSMPPIPHVAEPVRVKKVKVIEGTKEKGANLTYTKMVEEALRGSSRSYRVSALHRCETEHHRLHKFGN